MNDAIKLSLSADELELVCNKDWILTKKIVIDKVYFLMGEVSQKMQQCVDHNKSMLPAVVVESSPKISRGENYRGLPYVMLDYPRYFKANEDTESRRYQLQSKFLST